jgi:hypothetical protein
MSPACRIYSIEIQIVQTYSAVPIEDYKIGVYDPEEYVYPSDMSVLHSAGEKPATNRPGKNASTLWQGSCSGISKGTITSEPLANNECYMWETEKIRLPVAAHIRPSTCDGYARGIWKTALDSAANVFDTAFLEPNRRSTSSTSLLSRCTFPSQAKPLTDVPSTTHLVLESSVSS